MSSFVPWRIVHLDLSHGLTELSGTQNLFIILWSDNLPLGQLQIYAEQLPMRVPDLANRIAQTITPAVGDRLFKEGFHAPMPTNLRGLQKINQPAELDRVLAITRPLEALDACHSERSFAARNAVEESRGVSGSADLRQFLKTRDPSTSLRFARDDARFLKISVVVCTRDRAESLRRCLRSLEKLSSPAHEIIIVDNAPQTDATRVVATEFPRARYVHEPRAGLDIARNTGAQNSTGEIVAFADDDVEVHPAWVAETAGAFADPEVMAVTGLVLPAELETEAQYHFETGWGFNRGYRAKVFDRVWFARELSCGAPADQVGAGANMAFRREIFTRLGGFDERLDVGAAGCSGDSEFWHRILAAGFLCRYEPAAVVFHHHRRDGESLRNQLYYYMRGHAAALLVQFERHEHFGNLRRLLLTLPWHFFKMSVRSAFSPSDFRLLWAQIAGHFSGIKFYFDQQ